MRLLRHPVVETLVVFAVVFVVDTVFSVLGVLGGFFVLQATLPARPWTLVTSVYAHAGLGHLLANAVALVLVGPLVARRTTRLRFHAFFVTTGALAGLAEVYVGGLVGPARGVIGASGAVFALLGYLLAGNVVSTTLLDRIALSARAQLALFAVVAVAVTLATGAPGVALIGHGTGLLLGLIAGRSQLLDAV